MTRLERVRAALAGAAVDRPPYGFWTHLPGIDLDPPRLAEATAAFAARHDLDFVKSMSNGLYCVEDWGCVCDYSEIERGGVAKVTVAAIREAADWTRLAEVEAERGAFGRELDHFARLVALVGSRVPVLATVFSPLTIAGKLSNGLHRQHLRSAPDALRAGLDTITRVTCRFAQAALARGCAGVFFAIQEASFELMDEADYRRFGEPYDRRVLDAAAAAGGWFNTVHMHGEAVMFDLLREYPANALNWHVGETPPAIADYRATGGRRAVVGGLQRGHITNRELDAIGADIERAVAESGGRGLLLAPACVIRHPVDDQTLQATAAMIRGLARG
jgi:uroporphyrinogen decarboxylase